MSRDIQAANRTAGGKWIKGKSGNPSGRPRSYENVAELARTFTSDAIMTLARIATDRNAPAAAQVSAAEALLSRGWGKPVQQVDARVETVDMGALHLAALKTLAAMGATEPGPVLDAEPVPALPSRGR